MRPDPEKLFWKAVQNADGRLVDLSNELTMLRARLRPKMTPRSPKDGYIEGPPTKYDMMDRILADISSITRGAVTCLASYTDGLKRMTKPRPRKGPPPVVKKGVAEWRDQISPPEKDD